MSVDELVLTCPECGGSEKLARCCEFWIPRLKRARRNRELRAEPVVVELELAGSTVPT